ncbi:terpene synthase-like isoform X1 [Tenebrio molitor]|uniref:terpene synthase-like isoform X1 n=1 Tax=Tenebrio molitor TaxID=7067 RepID=UPI0036248F30
MQTSKMSKTEEEILFIPYTHIKEAPKINVISMAKLMQAYNFWLRIPKDKFQIIKEISELTDTGCFMLDELQSLCEPRKAIGMHQAVDSIASTINAANYAGCNALEKCLELDHSKAGSIYIEQMMQFYRGLGSEIYWRDNYVCPTEEEYRKMCIRKKGSNYQIAVQLMQLFSTNTCDFTKLTDILAQFFQIYEDYIHLCTKEQVWGGNCFEEGTFSFPIIHAIRSHPGDNHIVNVLKQKPKGNQMKLYVTTLLENFGSFEYTKQEILRLRDEIEEEMGKFDENPYMIQLTESVISQLVKVL